MTDSNRGYSFTSIVDDVVMVLLALISAALLVIEYSTELSPLQLLWLDRVDITIALIFLLEFVAKFIYAPHKGKYFKKHWWELLASIPVTTPATQGLRLLRLLRLIRLLRLNEGLSEVFNYLGRFFKKTHIIVVFTAWLLVMLAGTFAFYGFEHGVNDTVKTLFDALWWSMSTITTVGYGDIYPHTVGGRIVGMLLMIAGIGTTGIVTGLVASFLVESAEHQV